MKENNMNYFVCDNPAILNSKIQYLIYTHYHPMKRSRCMNIANMLPAHVFVIATFYKLFWVFEIFSG